MLSIDLKRYEAIGRLFSRWGSLPAFVQKKNATAQDVTALLKDLNWLLSLLMKAESLSRLHFVHAERIGLLLSPETMTHVLFMKEYLERFSSLIFSFSRSERQTFVFVLENVWEYLRQQEALGETGESSSRGERFIESRFWLENLLKIIDEKLSITLGENVRGEAVLIDSNCEITLFPFIKKDGQEYFFFYDITEQGPRYLSLDHQRQRIGDEHEKRALAEYLTQSLGFSELQQLLHVVAEGEESILKAFAPLAAAANHYREENWESVLAELNGISPELRAKAPLAERMRVRALLHLQKSSEAITEAKHFLTSFPAYTNMYEVLAESYEQKEDFNAALSAYERALQFGRNRSINNKIKEIKQRLKDKKEPLPSEAGDYFTPLVADEEQRALWIPRPGLVRQMMEILGSEHSANLLLVGDGGVGKTNLIMQLAAAIASDKRWQAVFSFREIRSIQFVHLLTGSKYRGQFEEKVLAMLKEAEHQKILLVVEDIHLLVSQGTARGTALDFVNIVRPFLQERRLQLVATTHYEELKNTLERDTAFLGCFHQVAIRPLDDQCTLTLLERTAQYHYDQWGIEFHKEILPEMLELSRQVLKTRAFPDAPLMLMDRVSAKLRIQAVAKNDKQAVEVGPQILAETVGELANLPSQVLGISINDRLRGLRERMSSHIVGQTPALAGLVSRITAYKRGFKIRDNRPDGVFLLVGPTGVGKTETALVLAQELLGSRDALLRIDMSEYMEKFTYSRFVGAAPGYVGYNDTNQLTDKVRQNPFTIILLDEVEKADPQLLNIFLQVFDAGRLTDARGRVVDFSKTIILLTSNVGTDLFGVSHLGYQEQGREPRVGDSTLLKAVKKRFSPEFLNRLDDILVFQALVDDDARHIVELHLQPIKRQLLREGKMLTLAPLVISKLASEGVSSQYGARQLARQITKTLLEPMAELALTPSWHSGDLIKCDLHMDKLHIHIGPRDLDCLEPVLMQLGSNRCELERDV